MGSAENELRRKVASLANGVREITVSYTEYPSQGGGIP